jgi:hypothetical protein
VVITNAIVSLDRFLINSQASDGFGVLHVDQSSGNADTVTSTLPLPSKFIVFDVVRTNWLPRNMKVLYHNFPANVLDSELAVAKPNDEYALLFGAKLQTTLGSSARTNLDLLQYQKDAWTTARLHHVVASGTITGDGAGLTNIPSSAIDGERRHYLRGGDLSTDGSFARCNSANALPPYYFMDGLQASSAPASFSFGVPSWVTQCVFSATLQCTAATAWTNTVYSYWQFAGGRAFNRSDPVTVGSNGLQTFSFVASWPETNAVKQVQVIFGGATNLPSRVLAAPFSLVYQ